MLRMLCCLFLLTACSERLTPWAITVPEDYKDLTARNLAKVQALPEPSWPLRIALMGDPQGTPYDLEKVVERINERDDVNLVLVLGDLTDYGLQHEYIWAGQALEKLRVPNLTVVGNHDAIAHGKRIYQDMFGPFDYTFTYAGLKFVLFNNNQFEFGDTDFSWLQQQIDENTITASHIPPVVDAHRPEQVALWKGNNTQAGILASLHGHRGGKTDFLSFEEGIPYYVVPKVEGVRYSIMTINEDRTIRFDLCHVTCSEEK
ncbi:metallophosphoesterase family protein [Oligoflexus tunisiensis]|uniref:metallophosphoesterase family protein n=1 Tax=Oligoflexus tunisiensis TaxID=708132 RepID=UPI00114D28DA|nr:metallophosphoesterase [Oligoflexus tunisiensis]